ncbi:MAG: hypothetical protein NVS3B24_14600 [Candidatus Dormibacteria bacterium]
MTATLFGRIQTRLFMIATVALLWTLAVTPSLPIPRGMDSGDAYRITLPAIAVVAVVGVAWELIYHGLQQFRWDKDWPTLFLLLSGINEAASTWVVLHWIDRVPGTYSTDNPIFKLFVIHFATTWVLVWALSNVALRVPFLRWRFHGGEIFVSGH